jgi:hypothetical protein
MITGFARVETAQTTEPPQTQVTTAATTQPS